MFSEVEKERRAFQSESGRAKRSPHPQALSYTIDDACYISGFGRTTAYRLAKEGKLVLVKVAGRTLVNGDSLRSLLSANAS